jgi:hypothetical protein
VSCVSVLISMFCVIELSSCFGMSDEHMRAHSAANLFVWTEKKKEEALDLDLLRFSLSLERNSRISFLFATERFFWKAVFLKFW